MLLSCDFFTVTHSVIHTESYYYLLSQYTLVYYKESQSIKMDSRPFYFFWLNSPRHPWKKTFTHNKSFSNPSRKLLVCLTDRGILQNIERWICQMSLSLICQVPFKVIKTGKTELKPDSLSFLILMTKLHSNLTFCFRRTLNAECQETLKFSE